MRIAIDVNVEPGNAGGVAPAVRSLITALGRLTDGPEEYTIVVGSDRQIEWLRPLGANQKAVIRARLREPRVVRQVLWRVHDRLFAKPVAWPQVPVSDGFYEKLGCDAIHFPTPEFTLCSLPSIYNPIDLQHLYYPQFFTPAELAARETIYSAGCRFARTIIVNSQWIKDDVIRNYGTWPGKVEVIPEAAPAEFSSASAAVDTAAVKGHYGLPDGFAFYPSVNWPHKNHLRLLEALAYLRDRRGLVVPLVCTGARHEASWPAIEAKVAALALTDQVRFLGFVSQDSLHGLYRLASCLVLPSLFEANSLPIFEAWQEGVPVACSNATALPEQVMDAGLLFDPLDIAAMGDAIARLHGEARLRDDLREKGRRRLASFDWEITAKAYRDVYRRAANGIPGQTASAPAVHGGCSRSSAARTEG